MGLRETINENQNVATGVTAGVLVLAIALIIWQLMPEKPPEVPTKAYYTVDEGQTTFADELDKVVPFKKDGKDAYRARVFECDGKQFVGYIEAFTPQAKEYLDKFYANPRNKGQYPMKRYELEESAKLVKKPGSKGWIPIRHPQADSVVLVKCEGEEELATEVYPEN